MIRYDFPHRLRGIAAAERELRRLGRSLSAAARHRDHRAVDYLERRLKRAWRAYHAIRNQLIKEEP